MLGMGEYEFLGYLVQKTKNLLLIFVPDEIPDDENTQGDAEGVYLKADLAGMKENVLDLERMDPGRMLLGVGRLTIPKNRLPEVYLTTLLVLWRKREGLTIPDFLLETILEDVQVRSHLRNLPAGMHASEEQIRKALKAGIILPEGYTYVSDHERKYEKEIKNPKD